MGDTLVRAPTGAGAQRRSPPRIRESTWNGGGEPRAAGDLAQKINELLDEFEGRQFTPWHAERYREMLVKLDGGRAEFFAESGRLVDISRCFPGGWPARVAKASHETLLRVARMSPSFDRTDGALFALAYFHNLECGGVKLRDEARRRIIASVPEADSRPPGSWRLVRGAPAVEWGNALLDQLAREAAGARSLFAAEEQEVFLLRLAGRPAPEIALAPGGGNAPLVLTPFPARAGHGGHGGH